MKKVLCRLLFRILGWKMRGEIPSMKKYIVITAPHTSNWDFFIGRCFAYIHDIKASELGYKQTPNPIRFEDCFPRAV